MNLKEVLECAIAAHRKLSIERKDFADGIAHAEMEKETRRHLAELETPEGLPPGWTVPFPDEPGTIDGPLVGLSGEDAETVRKAAWAVHRVVNITGRSARITKDWGLPGRLPVLNKGSERSDGMNETLFEITRQGNKIFAHDHLTGDWQEFYLPDCTQAQLEEWCVGRAKQASVSLREDLDHSKANADNEARL